MEDLGRRGLAVVLVTRSIHRKYPDQNHQSIQCAAEHRNQPVGNQLNQLIHRTLVEYAT